MTPYQKQLLVELISSDQQNQNGGGYPMQQHPGMGQVFPMPYPGQQPQREIEIPVRLVPSMGANPMHPMMPMGPPGPPPDSKPAPRSGGMSFLDVAIIMLILFVFFIFFMAAFGG